MAQAYKKSLTLAESQSGTADSTDWPLAICLDGNVQSADADLKTIANGGYVANANGYDIRPYSDSALTTALAYELVFYEATTGKLEMHVKIPTLSTSTDTVIYLGFGDTGLTTDGSSTNTWNSAFKAVYHLKDGSTLSYADSTSNAENGSAFSTPSATTGQMNGGMAVTGTQGMTRDFNYHAVAVPFTVSAWIKPTGTTGERSIWAGKNPAGGSFQFRVTNSTNKLQVLEAGVVGVAFPDLVATDNVWSFVAVTIDGSSNGKIYLNNSTPATFTHGNFLDHEMGLGVSHHNENFVGSLDETRWSNVERSTSWLTAEYNSQKASSTFITWGSRTAVGSSQRTTGPLPIYFRV